MTPGLLSREAVRLLRYLFTLERPPRGTGSKATYTEGSSPACIPPVSEARMYQLAKWARSGADAKSEEFASADVVPETPERLELDFAPMELENSSRCSSPSPPAVAESLPAAGMSLLAVIL